MRVNARFDKTTVWSKGDSVRYLVVDVHAPAESARAARPKAPLNVALVVDASGSMSGEPLQFALDAAHRLIDCLWDDDTLSIVSFESNVVDCVVSQRMDAKGRASAQQALRSIRASGNTNLSGGWLRGAEHVATRMESAQTATQNRVIVLSDGHANEGEVNPALLAQHATELARRGLFTTTVGIGDRYDSNTLEAMAVNGGGTLHHAARPHEIVEVVSAELQEFRNTAAISVKLYLQHDPDVRIKCLNEFPLTHDDEMSFCELGSLVGGGSRSAIFRIRFPEAVAGTHFAFEVSASWRRPGEEDVFSTQQVTATAVSATATANNASARDLGLVEQVALIWQAAIIRRIVQLNRERRFAEAQKRLDQDLELFRKYASDAVSGPRLIEELEHMRRVVDREWGEGNLKEMQVMFNRCVTNRVDVRAAAPTHLASLLPQGPKKRR